MAKSSPKGKKPATNGAPKAKPARAPKVVKSTVADSDEDSSDLDDEDDDEEDAKPASKAAAPAKKPVVKGRSPDGPEPPPVVPARRLTPEAKAKVNEMVAKGMPLGDALKMAASWETFVAPVKDEPAKLVQGKSFDGTPRPRTTRGEDDEPEAPEHSGDDDEPVVEVEE